LKAFEKLFKGIGRQRRSELDDLVGARVSTLESRLKEALLELNQSDQRYQLSWADDRTDLARAHRDPRDKAFKKLLDVLEELQPLQVLVDWHRQKQWWWVGVAGFLLAVGNLLWSVLRTTHGLP
jgi:hypothetical protein